jgi:hypothetical protein
MILTRNSDVKDPLSVRWRAGRSPYLSVSQPGATGFSEADPRAIKVELSGFAEDFHGEHSSRGTQMVPAAQQPSSASVQVPDIPGSAL